MKLDLDSSYLENNFDKKKIYVLEKETSFTESKLKFLRVESSILKKVKGLVGFNYLDKKYEYIENFSNLKEYLLNSVGKYIVGVDTAVAFAPYTPLVINVVKNRSRQHQTTYQIPKSAKVHEFDNERQVKNYIMALEMKK